jgi:hypothetical protein
MSVRALIGCPEHCSGAMYAGVPTARPSVSPVLACQRTSPKSRMRTCSPMPDLLLTMTFAGLMSRWMIPSSWAWPSPDRICFTIDAARPWLKVPSASSSFSVLPRTSSITMYGLLP